LWVCRIRLVEHAHARFDEQAGFGLEIQRREFFHRSAYGAVGTGDDILAHISIVQHFRGCPFEPGAVEFLAVQGQAGYHARLVEAGAVVEALGRINPRDLGRDLAIGNGDHGRGGEQRADRCTGCGRRLYRLGP
jgi:cold shock CspA family protein